MQATLVVSLDRRICRSPAEIIFARDESCVNSDSTSPIVTHTPAPPPQATGHLLANVGRQWSPSNRSPQFGQKIAAVLRLLRSARTAARRRYRASDFGSLSFTAIHPAPRWFLSSLCWHQAASRRALPRALYLPYSYCWPATLFPPRSSSARPKAPKDRRDVVRHRAQ